MASIFLSYSPKNTVVIDRGRDWILVSMELIVEGGQPFTDRIFG